MNALWLALICAAAILCAPHRAAACSCAFKSQEGFVPDVQGPLTLPSNARGVLYYRPLAQRYRAPTALAAVDPQGPGTRAALIGALEHGDGIVRGTAATALGVLGSADLATVAALTVAAGADNSDAIKSLGEIGQPAASAVPVLREKVLSSTWPHIAQAAMIALARIAPDLPDVLAAIARRLDERKPNDYTRQYALEALGKAGTASRPYAGRMVKVLSEQPTASEVTALLTALETIGPDPAEVAAPLRAYQPTEDWLRERLEQYLRKLGR